MLRKNKCRNIHELDLYRFSCTLFWVSRFVFATWQVAMAHQSVVIGRKVCCYNFCSISIWCVCMRVCVSLSQYVQCTPTADLPILHRCKGGRFVLFESMFFFFLCISCCCCCYLACSTSCVASLYKMRITHTVTLYQKHSIFLQFFLHISTYESYTVEYIAIQSFHHLVVVYVQELNILIPSILFAHFCLFFYFIFFLFGSLTLTFQHIRFIAFISSV